MKILLKSIQTLKNKCNGIQQMLLNMEDGLNNIYN